MAACLAQSAVSTEDALAFIQPSCLVPASLYSVFTRLSWFPFLVSQTVFGWFLSSAHLSDVTSQSPASSLSHASSYLRPGHTYVSLSPDFVSESARWPPLMRPFPPECPPDSSNLMDSKIHCFSSQPSPPTLPVGERRRRTVLQAESGLLLSTSPTHGPLASVSHLFTSQLFHSTSV